MENKTGKYFKYAIGEIVLVVIGILIAVGINSMYNASQNEAKIKAPSLIKAQEMLRKWEAGDKEVVSLWK